MDPEDLLAIEVSPLAALPMHVEDNRRALEMLVELNTSYRYTWFDVSERFGSESGMELGARVWNEAMARAQKVRLEPVVVVDDGGAAITAQTEE